VAVFLLSRNKEISLTRPASFSHVFHALLLAAALAPASASALVLFQDNFESYTPGTGIVGQNGWVGTGLDLVNTAAHLEGTSLLGPVNNGINQLNVFGHGIGSSLTAGLIYTLSFDTYARSTPLITHSSGMGVGNTSNTAAGAFAGSAMWVPGEFAYNTYGWRFDARQLTGGSGDYLTIFGGYDAIETLEIVIDGIAMEIYGRYDFGAGVQETTHYAIDEAKLTSIDAVAAYADYRGENYGATTPWGKRFTNAEYDNVVFASSADVGGGSVPSPGALSLLLAGILALGASRRTTSA
jgi:hypothetical protein